MAKMTDRHGRRSEAVVSYTYWARGFAPKAAIWRAFKGIMFSECMVYTFYIALCNTIIMWYLFSSMYVFESGTGTVTSARGKTKHKYITGIENGGKTLPKLFNENNTLFLIACQTTLPPLALSLSLSLSLASLPTSRNLLLTDLSLSISHSISGSLFNPHYLQCWSLQTGGSIAYKPWFLACLFHTRRVCTTVYVCMEIESHSTNAQANTLFKTQSVIVSRQVPCLVTWCFGCQIHLTSKMINDNRNVKFHPPAYWHLVSVNLKVEVELIKRQSATWWIWPAPSCMLRVFCSM